MKKRSSIIKVLILVTILALPGFLYYLLQEKGKNRYRPLDIYGPKQVAGTFHLKRGKQIPDTLYHTIRDFKLLSSTGDSIGLSAGSRQVTVVNFFFSRCDRFCTSMNTQFARVVSEFPKNKMLKFYSISVDPEYDRPQVLKEYAKQFNPDPQRWYFLTGDKRKITDIASNDFLVDAIEDRRDSLNIIHSPMFILLDTKKRIRGFYDSGSKDQVNKLMDEIRVQITEELRNVSSLKPIKNL